MRIIAPQRSTSFTSRNHLSRKAPIFQFYILSGLIACFSQRDSMFPSQHYRYFVSDPLLLSYTHFLKDFVSSLFGSLLTSGVWRGGCIPYISVRDLRKVNRRKMGRMMERFPTSQNCGWETQVENIQEKHSLTCKQGLLALKTQSKLFCWQ